MSLSADQILAADDIVRETVQVPEWKGEVIVAEMTGEVRDAWEQSLVAGKGELNVRNVRARLLAACAINENGERLFTESQAEALGKKSGRALERCVKVIQRLNALSDRDIEAAAKN